MGAATPPASRSGRGSPTSTCAIPTSVRRGRPSSPMPPAGAFILGLGVSHPPVNRALGIDMPDPPAALRRYVSGVRAWLRAEGPATHLPPASRGTRGAALRRRGDVVDRGAGRGARRRDHAVSVDGRAGRPEQGVGRARPRQGPLSSDRSTSRSGCPRSSATTWRRCATPLARTSCCTRPSRSFSGCSGSAASPPRRLGWNKRGGVASLTDRLLDAVCLLGPLARCRERLAAFRHRRRRCCRSSCLPSVSRGPAPSSEASPATRPR